MQNHRSGEPEAGQVVRCVVGLNEWFVMDRKKEKKMKKMKKWIISVILMTGVCANASTYIRTATGDWSDLTQWWDNSSGTYAASSVLPGASDAPVLNNNITVDLDVDTVISSLTVANQNVKSGTLNLNSAGVKLSAGTIAIGGYGTTGIGTVNVSAGTLVQPGRLTVNSGSFLNINGGTFSGSDTASTELVGGGTVNMTSGLFDYANTVVYQIDNALFEISGGTVSIDSQVRVGHSSGGSELRIVGDAATINFASLNQNSSYSADGTFRFVLDETGVSTVNMSDWMHLDAADIIVDGSAYTGGAANILLFDSPNLASTSANPVVITGFDPSFDVSVVQSQAAGENWVQLQIIPEPATIGLLSMAALLALAVRRFQIS